MLASPGARAVKYAFAFAAALALASCAQNAANDDPSLFGGGMNGRRAGGAGGINGSGLTGPGSPQEFADSIGNKVLFEMDSTELTPTAQAILDKQARWLQKYTQYTAIRIEGHADERGTREYNIGLGNTRAIAVKNYLQSRGVTAQISTLSYGKDRPVAFCDDESCWSQNRRAVTSLTRGGDS